MGAGGTGGNDRREAIAVAIEIAPPLERVAAFWQALAPRRPASFFLTWHWVGCWLRESGVSPILVRATRGDAPVGAAILCRPEDAAGSRLAPMLCLTSVGGGAIDSPFIEYNGFIAAADGTGEIERAIAARLLALPSLTGRAGEPPWTHLLLPGVDANMRALVAACGLRVRVLAERPSPFIDLAAMRRSGAAYLDTRSRNLRQQVRRSMRLFEGEGPLELTAAGTLGEAYAMFQELKALHQAQWTARGKPGAFAEPFFERFHRALIEDAWPAGKIDLLRLTAGARTLGCLYNFRHEGRAYAYQSGFAWDDDARRKPGLVAHTLAAQRYLAAGLDRYLLLAGEGRYKTSLATHADTLFWLEARRPGLAGMVGTLATAPERLIGRVARRLGQR